ncbi:MAG TPA: hypothetical protein VF855_04605 [Acidimicrobiales bacterium]
MQKKKIRGRALVVLLGIAGVAGVSVASASSLGGINGTTVGSDTAVIGTCDTDGVNVSFQSSYDDALNGYGVTGVTVDSIDPNCAGKAISVTIENALGVSDSTVAANVSGTTAVLTFTAGGILAEEASNVAVLITG